MNIIITSLVTNAELYEIITNELTTYIGTAAATILGTIVGLVIVVVKITKTVKSLKSECKSVTDSANDSASTSKAVNLIIREQNLKIEEQNKLIAIQSEKITSLEKEMRSNNIAKLSKAIAILVNSQPEMIKNGVARKISKTLGYDKDKDVNSDVSEGSGNK